MLRVNTTRPARPMRPSTVRGRWGSPWAAIRSIWVAAGSIVRGLPLLLAPRPRTALRVLCIMAFDTVQVRRHRRPLPAARVRFLAALLDFGAFANATFDRKHRRRRERCERRSALKLLKESGIGPTLTEYLRRLRHLERSRPSPFGDASRFQDVRVYREAVVRLSLAMVAAAADGSQPLDQWIGATDHDPDLNCLFRMAMQCQIIDDVLDCSSDLSSALPTFLTACKSLRQAFDLTRLAAIAYAADRNLPNVIHLAPEPKCHPEPQAKDLASCVQDPSEYLRMTQSQEAESFAAPVNNVLPRTEDDFALRSALVLVSACAKLTIAIGRWKTAITR